MVFLGPVIVGPADERPVLAQFRLVFYDDNFVSIPQARQWQHLEFDRPLPDMEHDHLGTAWFARFGWVKCRFAPDLESDTSHNLHRGFLLGFFRLRMASPCSRTPFGRNSLNG